MLEMQRMIGGDSPALDASLLIGFVCGKPREQLYTDLDFQLLPEQEYQLHELTRQRAAGIPVAYLLGAKEFYGREFKVDARALIPRPDTEILVEAGLQAIDARTADHTASGGRRPLRVLDLCCGTGCIGITIAAERPDCELVLADIQQEALDLARENARRLLPPNSRPHIIRSDIFGSISGRFDIILTNPPYVSEHEYRELDMERWGEPENALVAGKQGLEIIRRIADTVVDYIYPNGYIAIEAADQQAAVIGQLLADRSFQMIEHYKDLGDHLRVTAATYPG